MQQGKNVLAASSLLNVMQRSKNVLIAREEGLLIYESGIYVPPSVLKWGLRERPLTENGGFQSSLSLKNEGILELNITKKHIFFKRGFFWSSPSRKSATNKCIFLKSGDFRSSPG